MQNPPTNKGQKFPAEPLTRKEVHALLGAASNRSSSGIRARALIAVMYGSGLRVAEVLALYPRDIDAAKGTIRVREGKGRKARLVGIDPYTASILARWLDRRTRLGLTARHPVFATYRESFGSPVGQRYVRQLLNRLAARADVTKRVHPHGLRHSFAFDLAERGTPMHQIQAQLGHSTLAATQRYISHLAPMDVVAAMQDRDWSDA